MIRINNKVQLIGTVMYINSKYFNNEVKSISFHLATTISKLDNQGKSNATETSHLCVAYGRHANTIEKLTDKGTKIAIEGVLISEQPIGKGEKRPTAYVQVEELLILNTK